MAYAIDRSNISSELANIIRSMLYLQPKVYNNKYNRNKISEPIIFYNTEKQIIYDNKYNSSEKNIDNLTLLLAASLL